jgi:hypothetical protein
VASCQTQGRSDSGGAGYNPELEDRWISLKLWKTGLQFSGSNSTKFSVRFKRWWERKLRRAGSSGTPPRLNGSSGWRKSESGMRSASLGSDAPRTVRRRFECLVPSSSPCAAMCDARCNPPRRIDRALAAALPTLPAFATCFSFCFPFCLRADDSAGSYEFLPNPPAKSVAKKVLEHLRKLLE